MSAERYVVLGLSRPRSPWFVSVARWSTSGSLAAEFVKTVSADEVHARLRSGRTYSALLVESAVPGVERDLVAAALERDVAVFVVDDHDRHWHQLGAAAVLAPSFERSELARLLDEHATPVRRADDIQSVHQLPITQPTTYRAPVVAVTGPGGTGASTLAIALAQGLAGSRTVAGPVLLCDLRLDADLALLHDAGDVVPGVVELVDAHRTGTPNADEVLRTTFDVTERGYRLLLGLRSHREWTALRPNAVRATVESLRGAAGVVVADVDAELEGEAETGSVDVEDRNALARTTIGRASAVVVVGRPGVTGVHGLLRVVRRLLAAGVDPAAIVPVVNGVPRGGRNRRQVVEAFHALLRPDAPDVRSPVFVEHRARVEEAHRDGSVLPAAVVRPVLRAVAPLLDGPLSAEESDLDVEPVPVVPGELGSWSEELAG